MAAMDHRSVLLLSVFALTTHTTPVGERCSHVPQTFMDPRTYLTHPCSYVCDYRTPAKSPMDCHELCPDLDDCLRGITRNLPEPPVMAAQVMARIEVPPTETTSTQLQSREQLTTHVEASLTVAQDNESKNLTLYILFGVSSLLIIVVVIVLICVCKKCVRTKGDNSAEKGLDVERNSFIEKTAEAKQPLSNGVAEHSIPWDNTLVNTKFVV